MIKNKLIEETVVKNLRGPNSRTIRYYACANKDCSNIIKIEPQKYNFYSKNPADNWITCCHKCNSTKYVTETLRGISNPFSREDVKQTIIATLQSKYGEGITNPGQVPEVKDKIKEAFKKYDGGHPLRDKTITDKIENTCLEKYGSKHYFSSDAGKESVKTSQFEKYGDWYCRTEMLKHITLEGLISQYGEAEGTKKYEEKLIKVIHSKDNYITRYGEEEGIKRFNEYCNGQSSISMNLYNILVEKYPDDIIEREYVINLRPFDFKIRNLIIEFNGDYWHCNPKKYAPDFVHKQMKKTAQELWDRDTKKLAIAHDYNYDTHVVWESDFLKNQTAVLEKIDELLTGNKGSANG